jgi:hypothetical protein
MQPQHRGRPRAASVAYGALQVTVTSDDVRGSVGLVAVEGEAGILARFGGDLDRCDGEADAPGLINDA